MKMKKVVITRKIQLKLLSHGEKRKQDFQQLYAWNDLAFRAANQVVSHLFFQEKQLEFTYFSKAFRAVLLDENLPVDMINNVATKRLVEDGALRMLNTSRQNSTYRILSEKYKGKFPSDIFNNINIQATKAFMAESVEYYQGKRSLRSYRKNMPIPFSVRSIKKMSLTEDKKNYSFNLFGVNFSTYFGKDLSGNRTIWDFGISGKYKFCNSAIQLSGSKIFLLAAFEFNANPSIVSNKQLHAELSATNPILASFENQQFQIGNKEEFLHQRLAIQAAMKRAQLSSKYAKGGRGRKHKTKNIDRFSGKEEKYINTKLHTYSKALVDLCLQNGCSKIILKYTPSPSPPSSLKGEEKKQWIKENEFILRNWSYSNLTEKLKYKCDRFGIILAVEDSK